MGIFRVLTSPFRFVGKMMAGDRGYLGYVGMSDTARTTAGESVTQDTSMTVSTYYACLRNLAEDIAKLPYIVYEREQPRGKKRATDHPIYRMLHDESNPNLTSFAFREMLTQWAAGWGIGAAEIQRANDGTPVAMWPIHPSRIERRLDADRNLFYVVHNDDGSTTNIAKENALVIDGFNGRSVLRYAAESLGLTIAAQKFGAAYYGNGMGLSVAIMHPGKLSKQAHTNMRDSWAKMHQGAGKAHNPFIGEEGVKIEKLSVPAEEAQFLQTRQFQVEEVCRWLRMPPHKVGHLARAAGWSTLEATNTDYIIDTLMPWMKRWENECNRKLFFAFEQPTYFAEMLVTALLRGDSSARATFYSQMFQIGALSQNDIRESENLNPIEGGDTYYVPMALRDSSEPVAAEAPPASPAPAAPAQQPEEIEDEDDDQPDAINRDRVILCHAKMLIANLQPVVDKECKAVARAAAKHAKPAEFIEWASTFFADQGGYVASTTVPIIESLITLSGTGSVDCVRSFATEHAESAKAEAIKAHANGSINDLVEIWTATVPARGSERLIDIWKDSNAHE